MSIDGGTNSVLTVATVFPGNNTGWAQATLLEARLQAGTAVGADSNMRVAYDSTTDEFVITNVLGREINISATTEPTAASTGQYFKTAAAVGAANKAHDVN